MDGPPIHDSMLCRRMPEIKPKVKKQIKQKEKSVDEPIKFEPFLFNQKEKSDWPPVVHQTIQNILVDFFIGLDYNEDIGKSAVNYRTDETNDPKTRADWIKKLVQKNPSDSHDVSVGKSIALMIFQTMDAEKVKSTQSRINANFTKIMNLLKGHVKEVREFEDPTRDTQRLVSDHEKFNKYVLSIRDFIAICIEFILKQIHARLSIKWITNSVSKINGGPAGKKEESKPQCPWTLYDMLRAMLALIQKYYIPKTNKLINSGPHLQIYQKTLEKLLTHKKQYSEFLSKFGSNRKLYCDLGKSISLYRPNWGEIKESIVQATGNKHSTRDILKKRNEAYINIKKNSRNAVKSQRSWAKTDSFIKGDPIRITQSSKYPDTPSLRKTFRVNSKRSISDEIHREDVDSKVMRTKSRRVSRANQNYSVNTGIENKSEVIVNKRNRNLIDKGTKEQLDQISLKSDISKKEIKENMDGGLKSENIGKVVSDDEEYPGKGFKYHECMIEETSIDFETQIKIDKANLSEDGKSQKEVIVMTESEAKGREYKYQWILSQIQIFNQKTVSK